MQPHYGISPESQDFDDSMLPAGWRSLDYNPERLMKGAHTT